VTPMEAVLLPRFWSKVEVVGECWLWTGNPAARYGQFHYEGENGKQTQTLVRRLTFDLFNGSIDPDLTIDHLCRVKKCVNPAHLEQVPLDVNILRSDGAGAKNARATSCPRGHALTGDNVLIRHKQRNCKLCLLAYQREWQRKDRAKRAAAKAESHKGSHLPSLTQ
jgi:hypothetical protein